jgi:hypothetical protein
MKTTQLEDLLRPHGRAIHAIAQSLKAPLQKFVCSGAINLWERKKQRIGRLFLILEDDSPGWRAQDTGEARADLKDEVGDMLAVRDIHLTIRVQAYYSCLRENDNEIERLDTEGRTIGIYAP